MSNALQFAVGSRVNIIVGEADNGDDIYSPGTVKKLDTNDADLPYFIQYDSGSYSAGWIGADMVFALDVSDAEKRLDALSPLELAVRLQQAFNGDGEVTVKEISTVARMLTDKLSAGSKPATGVCSSCYSDVTFNTSTGKWDHAEAVDHAVPAVIPS